MVGVYCILGVLLSLAVSVPLRELDANHKTTNPPKNSEQNTTTPPPITTKPPQNSPNEEHNIKSIEENVTSSMVGEVDIIEFPTTPEKDQKMPIENLIIPTQKPIEMSNTTEQKHNRTNNSAQNHTESSRKKDSDKKKGKTPEFSQFLAFTSSYETVSASGTTHSIQFGTYSKVPTVEGNSTELPLESLPQSDATTPPNEVETKSNLTEVPMTEKPIDADDSMTEKPIDADDSGSESVTKIDDLVTEDDNINVATKTEVQPNADGHTNSANDKRLELWVVIGRTVLTIFMVTAL